jgi:hypothetical protein
MTDPDTSIAFDSSGELLLDSIVSVQALAFTSPACASKSTIRQHRDEPLLACAPDTQGRALVGELLAKRESSKAQRLVSLDEVKQLIDEMRKEDKVRLRLSTL